MLKLALVLAVVLFFIWLVAVGVLYGVLDGMGVWDRLNGTYADLVSGEAQTGSTLISAGRVFGLAAVIGAINSLLFAVAVTVGAFVYNVSADLVGGIEVTLSERDDPPSRQARTRVTSTVPKGPIAQLVRARR